MKAVGLIAAIVVAVMVCQPHQSDACNRRFVLKMPQVEPNFKPLSPKISVDDPLESSSSLYIPKENPYPGLTEEIIKKPKESTGKVLGEISKNEDKKHPEDTEDLIKKLIESLGDPGDSGGTGLATNASKISELENRRLEKLNKTIFGQFEEMAVIRKPKISLEKPKIGQVNICPVGFDMVVDDANRIPVRCRKSGQ